MIHHFDVKCSIALIKSSVNFARYNDFISHFCRTESKAFLQSNDIVMMFYFLFLTSDIIDLLINNCFMHPHTPFFRLLPPLLLSYDNTSDHIGTN